MARPLRRMAAALALGLLASLVGRGVALADDASMNRAGETVRPVSDTEVTMVDEKVNIDIASMSVDVTFTFRNDGPAAEVLMGFPMVKAPNQGDEIPQEPQPYFGFESFHAYLVNPDGTETELPTKVEDQRPPDDSPLYFPKWVTFDVPFAEGQVRQVRNVYRALPRFSESNGYCEYAYVLNTGATWKGLIHRAEVTVDLGDIQPYEISSVAPEGYSIVSAETTGRLPTVGADDKDQEYALHWAFEDFEPTADIVVAFRDFAEPRWLLASWEVTRDADPDDRAMAKAWVDGRWDDVVDMARAALAELPETAGEPGTDDFIDNQYTIDHLQTRLAVALEKAGRDEEAAREYVRLYERYDRGGHHDWEQGFPAYRYLQIARRIGDGAMIREAVAMATDYGVGSTVFQGWVAQVTGLDLEAISVDRAADAEAEDWGQVESTPFLRAMSRPHTDLVEHYGLRFMRNAGLSWAGGDASRPGATVGATDEESLALLRGLAWAAPARGAGAPGVVGPDDTVLHLTPTSGPRAEKFFVVSRGCVGLALRDQVTGELKVESWYRPGRRFQKAYQSILTRLRKRQNENSP